MKAERTGACHGPSSASSLMTWWTSAFQETRCCSRVPFWGGSSHGAFMRCVDGRISSLLLFQMLPTPPPY